jgi:glucose-1-phosphate thymidylyltransferase
LSIKNLDKIYVVTNDKFYKNFTDWKEKEWGTTRIEIINDRTTRNEERIGGVMDFALALEKINEDIMIIFGDVYFNFSLNIFAEYFNSREKVCVALYDLKDKEKAKRFGVIEMNGDKIAGFEEKPEHPKSTLVNAGAYIFPKESISDLKDYIKSGKNKENIGFIIIDFLRRNMDIRGFVFDEDWYDIGTKEDYEKIKEEIGKYKKIEF